MTLRATLYPFTLLITSFINPVFAADLPTHFDGCDQKDVAYFAYTKDRQEAVEMCRTAEGYRFSYGPMNKPDIRLNINRNEVYSAEVEEERGVMIVDDYVIVSGLKGKSHFYINKVDGQLGDWAKEVELEDRAAGFVNELYCVTDTPCRH